MRPLRLEIQAFGPYPGREIIDFRRLGDCTLFLIHGPTGAGKTSILDAISFALYGKPAGSNRDERRMRSDHADPHTATEVVFEFSLRDHAYRVYRKPEYAVPKRRGQGKTSLKAEAYVALLGAANAPNRTKELVSGWRNVTAKIEELLGFRSDQFSQVVMLPQGEFQRLLMANSRERQPILEVLFQTEWYTRIEQALKTNAAELKTAFEKLSDRRDDVLKRAEAESLEMMQQRRVDNEQRHKDLTARLKQMEADATKAAQALENGRRISEKFKERREAQNNLANIESQAAVIESKKRELDLARRAQKIVPEEKNLQRRADELAKAEHARNAARSAEEAARAEKDRAAQRRADQKSKEPEIERAKHELGRLEALRESVEQHDIRQREAQTAQKEFDAADKKFKNISELLEKNTLLLEELKKEKEEAQKTAGSKELLTMQLNKLNNELKNLKEFNKLEVAAKEKEKELKGAVQKVNDLEKAVSESKAQCKILEDAWIKGQASVLAQKLVQGEPCPVCGSREHPQPAPMVEGLPDEEALTNKREALERDNKNLQDAIEARTRFERDLAEMRIRIETLRESLEDVKGLSEKDLEREKKKLTADLEAAKKADGRIAGIDQTMEQFNTKLAKAKKDQDEAQTEKEAAKTKLDSARAAADTLAKNIPDHLRSLDALEKEKTLLSKKISDMEAALKKTEQDLQQAEKDVAAKEAARKAAEDNYMEAARNMLNQTQAFEKLLRKHGFRDDMHFKESKRSDAEIDGLQSDIERFGKDLKSAKDRLERAEKEVVGIEEPDIDSLVESAETAKRQHQEKLKEEAALASELANQRKLIEGYKELQDQAEAMERRLLVAETLSSTANGRNPLGVTFQRFVLSTLLDDVLAAATQRFHIMSNGRFALNRLGERTDKRSPGGLDIEVYDAYTGVSRPVNTLSGGEGFLASLSLALGLADVVQAYAGGIHLDAIFVDEGFGSLDPEALDLAFRALEDLQQSGRLVGVISHVPELKERIAARLEVMPSRRGSTARLIAP